MSLRVALIGALSVFMATGCGETRDDPPDGRFRFLHAAPTLGSSAFLLEESQPITLNYSSGNGTTLLDSGPFDFNVETPSPTSATNVRTVRLAATIVAEQLHTFVLFDDGAAPTLQEFVRPFVDVTAGNGGLEVLHAFPGGPTVDVYVEPEGADLLAATSRGTLSPKQLIEPFTVATGVHRLTLTEVGSSANIVYQSTQISVGDGTQALLAIFDDAGLGTAAIRAAIIDSGAAAALALPDSLSPPELRTIHAATTAGPLDVVVDGGFANPLHAGFAFTTVTEYLPIPSGESMLQITPAGDPGVIEVEETVIAGVNTRLTQIINGAPGALTSVLLQDNNRSVSARATYRVRNGGQLLPAVDLYLSAPGTGADLTVATPVAVGVSSGATDFLSSVLPGEMELLVVENDQDSTTTDTNIVAGPVTVPLTDGRVYNIVLFDSVTAGMLDVVVVDETAP